MTTIAATVAGRCERGPPRIGPADAEQPAAIDPPG
jgi:hypothetical protein